MPIVVQHQPSPGVVGEAAYRAGVGQWIEQRRAENLKIAELRQRERMQMRQLGAQARQSAANRQFRAIQQQYQQAGRFQEAEFQQLGRERLAGLQAIQQQYQQAGRFQEAAFQQLGRERLAELQQQAVQDRAAQNAQIKKAHNEQWLDNKKDWDTWQWDQTQQRTKQTLDNNWNRLHEAYDNDQITEPEFMAAQKDLLAKSVGLRESARPWQQNPPTTEEQFGTETFRMTDKYGSELVLGRKGNGDWYKIHESKPPERLPSAPLPGQRAPMPVNPMERTRVYNDARSILNEDIYTDINGKTRVLDVTDEERNAQRASTLAGMYNYDVPPWATKTLADRKHRLEKAKYGVKLEEWREKLRTALPELEFTDPETPSGKGRRIKKHTDISVAAMDDEELEEAYLTTFRHAGLPKKPKPPLRPEDVEEMEQEEVERLDPTAQDVDDIFDVRVQRFKGEGLKIQWEIAEKEDEEDEDELTGKMLPFPLPSDGDPVEGRLYVIQGPSEKGFIRPMLAKWVADASYQDGGYIETLPGEHERGRGELPGTPGPGPGTGPGPAVGPPDQPAAQVPSKDPRAASVEPTDWIKLWRRANKNRLGTNPQSGLMWKLEPESLFVIPEGLELEKRLQTAIDAIREHYKQHPDTSLWTEEWREFFGEIYPLYENALDNHLRRLPISEETQE